MDILGLTTTEAVRALIGIDEASQELPDQLFTDFELEDALALELGTWLPMTVSAVIEGGDGSGDDGDLAYIALRSASKAWCAWQVLQAAEISLATKHEDGQNAMTRQAFKTEEILNRLGSLYSRYRELCLTYLGSVVTVSSTSWLAGKSSPVYDPVTDTTSA